MSDYKITIARHTGREPMNNFLASVVDGTVALALLALRFFMDGDDYGVALVAVVAILAWASCYCTALYEQTAYRAFATAGIALTICAVAFGVPLVAQAVLA